MLSMAAHSLLASAGGAGPGDGIELCMRCGISQATCTRLTVCAFCVRRAASAGQQSPKLTGTWAKCLPVILGLSEVSTNRPPAG